APFATERSRFANPPEPGRRLRVGYVSGDFRHHSVAFFVEALVGAHDKREVEVFLFTNDARSDAATLRLKQKADHFVPIYNLPDDLAAAQIRQHGLDVLVDLSGHTSGNRMMLFARKPAPVQLTWLGYPATTGLPTIDGRITDAVADPPGESDRLHTERLIRLDGGFLCYRPLDQPAARARRGARHLRLLQQSCQAAPARHRSLGGDHAAHARRAAAAQGHAVQGRPHARTLPRCVRRRRRRRRADRDPAAAARRGGPPRA